jgi:hypothetical protein
MGISPADKFAALIIAEFPTRQFTHLERNMAHFATFERVKTGQDSGTGSTWGNTPKVGHVHPLVKCTTYAFATSLPYQPNLG